MAKKQKIEAKFIESEEQVGESDVDSLMTDIIHSVRKLVMTKDESYSTMVFGIKVQRTPRPPGDYDVVSMVVLDENQKELFRKGIGISDVNA